MRHALHVAVYSGHPLLGLFHDSVEDGYLPKRLCRIWPALDAITRRPDETYVAYIERVAANPAARRVKLCDLRHNLTRNGGPSPSLRRRYKQAIARLTYSEECFPDPLEAREPDYPHGRSCTIPRCPHCGGEEMWRER